MKKIFLSLFFSALIGFSVSAQTGPGDFIVTTTLDSGPGSLRQAILNANAYTGGTPINIYYRIPGQAATISIYSPLPVITALNLTSSNLNQGFYPLKINGNNIAGPVFRYSFAFFNNLSGIGINFAPTTYYVTTTIDGDPGSFRQMLGYAEQTLAKDYINFNIPGAAPRLLSYSGNIYIEQPIVIDGTTQPTNGYTGSMPKIELGVALTFYGKNSELYGLTLTKTSYLSVRGDSRIYPTATGSASGSIIGKSGGANVFLCGVNLSYTADVTFQNNYLGMDVQSTVASTFSSGLYFNQTKNTQILNNNIGNCDIGLWSDNDTNTVIRGNKIGTNTNGTSAVPNKTGLNLRSSINLMVGGTGAGQGNLISGNVDQGLICSASKQLVVQGNYIGTDVTGMLSIPNNKIPTYLNACGLSIGGCDSVLIGGNSTAASNVIASNAGDYNHHEIYIGWSQKTHLYGNKIGVAKDGITPLGKNRGIYVEVQSTVEIGKLVSGYGNIFSSFITAVVVSNYNTIPQYQSNVSIRGNIFFNNTSGIFSTDGAAPVITNVTLTKVEGYAAPSALIDLYYHSGTGDFQGKTYLATVTSNALGNWTYNGSISNACSITATATKAGRTTSFSQLYKFGNLGPDLKMCKGSSPVTLSASGGSNYSWSPAAGLSDAHLANPVFQTDASQTYIVSLTNSLGCAGSDTLNIIVDEALAKPNLGADTVICTGDSVLINGGNFPNASYLWSTGATTQTIRGFVENTYTLTVTNTCGSTKDTLSIGIASCGTISGNVYEDYNNNCTQEVSDVPLKRKLVKLLPGPLYAVTDTLGHYSVTVPYNTYDVALLPVSGRTQICHLGNYNAVVNNSSPDFSQANFTLLNGDTLDGRVLLSYTPAAVGRSFTYTAEIMNKGISTLNGQFIFRYDSLVNFVSADLAVTDHTDRVLTFDYSGIAKGTSLFIHLNFSVPPNAALSGKLTKAIAELPLTADFFPSDNGAFQNPFIRASFDPNIKEVFPSGATAAKLISTKDSVLQYTVRFQNEGSAPADSITILDTLSQYLNIETLEALHASHNYTLEIIGDNILKWTFQNINLPSKTTDEEASLGYLQFSIQTNKNLVPTTQIKNSAYIYFDYNPYVATNTVFNTLAFPLTATTATQDLSCSETGTIALAAVPAGGIPPYRYVWENKSDTDSLLTNLSNGAYQCIVRDASEEEVRLTATVSEPAALFVSSTVTNVSCQGNNDGQISLSGSGGSGSYSFDWSSGQSLPTISQLSSGTYTVTITDSEDCAITASFVLSESEITCLPTSTEKSLSTETVSVYPNPTKDHMVFEISTAYEGNFSLVIKDMTGREILRKENISGNSYTLFKTDLGSGIFMYSLYDSSKELGKGKIIVLD